MASLSTTASNKTDLLKDHMNPPSSLNIAVLFYTNLVKLSKYFANSSCLLCGLAVECQGKSPCPESVDILSERSKECKTCTFKALEMSVLLTQEDIEEHVFALSGCSENGLGIVARSASHIRIEDVCIQQSLSLLHQHSTGAVLWKTTPKFAKWLPMSPIGDLVKNKTVVELGSGTGALALLLADYVRRFILTDQKPLLKLARRNCEGLNNVNFEEFDWENQEFRGIEEDGILIACDTIYNDFLVKPFTDAVLSVLSTSPLILNVIICVQVRDLHVLESALTYFSKRFSITYYEIEKGFAAYVLSVKS